MHRATLPCRAIVLLAATVLPASLAFGQSLPVHAGTRVLRSGPLIVEVGAPESAECRWNRGVRFSPVANVLRVQLHGREFAYSPVSGGAVDSGFTGGLPMEFDIGQEAFQPDPPGYNEGRAGDPFLKIGVGILQRDGSAYSFSKDYPIIEAAQTTVVWHEDRARFVQTLAGTANGYACRLQEDLIVKNDRIIMKYVLRNTGTESFTTEQYIHNFLSFGDTPVGPDVRIAFPYEFTTSPAVNPWTPPTRRRLAPAVAPDVARIGNTIYYMQTISSVPKIWVYKPEDYRGPDLFAVEHTKTEQRVMISSSVPAVYVGIWTTNYQVSPEQFILITLAPGEEIEFTRTYVFSIDGFVREDCTADAAVDTNDLSVMASAWLSEPGSAAWDPSCDVSSPADDRIDLRDLAALAGQWQQAGGLLAPVAHWRLDETTGSAALDEREQNHGTLHHFPDGDTPWTAGMADGGLSFDGVDDYVEVHGYPGITGTGPRTVTAWVQLSEKPTEHQAIIAWGENAPGRYWLLEVDASRQLRFSCGTGSAVASDNLVGDTRWHHVAAVLDPIAPGTAHVTDVRLYVDGRRQDVFEVTEATINTGQTENLRIGASHQPGPSGHFHGIIDDVRLFDAALSTANIRYVYAQTASP